MSETQTHKLKGNPKNEQLHHRRMNDSMMRRERRAAIGKLKPLHPIKHHKLGPSKHPDIPSSNGSPPRVHILPVKEKIRIPADLSATLMKTKE